MILYRVWLNDKVRHFARRSEADAFVRFLGGDEVTLESFDTMNLHAASLVLALNALTKRFDGLLLLPDEIEISDGE